MEGTSGLNKPGNTVYWQYHVQAIPCTTWYVGVWEVEELAIGCVRGLQVGQKVVAS